MALLKVKNQSSKPQDSLISLNSVCVDSDGKSIKRINVAEAYKNTYKILFFFPMGTKAESNEVLKFSASLQKFLDKGCSIIGVTSESPLAIKRWMEKDLESGGFGMNLNFPIISDKDLSLSMSLGVARTCGLPARATFIIDTKGFIRYSMIHRASIGKNIPELLRLVSAFQISDSTGMATPAGWQPGSEDLIPTDYTDKVAYFRNKYGTKAQQKSEVNADMESGSNDKDNLSEDITQKDLNKDKKLAAEKQGQNESDIHR